MKEASQSESISRPDVTGEQKLAVSQRCERFASEIAESFNEVGVIAVLHGRDSSRTDHILYAASFSALQHCSAEWVGELSPDSDWETVEAATIEELEAYKAKMQNLANERKDVDLEVTERHWHSRVEDLKVKLDENKRQRDLQRADPLDTAALDALKAKSYDDSQRLRALKAKRHAIISSKRARHLGLTEDIARLRKQRRMIANRFQSQLLEEYLLRTIWRGEKEDLSDWLLQDPAARVITRAAQKGLEADGFAVFEMSKGALGNMTAQPGSFNDLKQTNAFPQLIAGLLDRTQRARGLPEIEIIHQDEHFVAVRKPSGLLAVPGRRQAQQDSVTARVALHFPLATGPMAVHRLDQATSGIMIVALSTAAHREFSILFQRRVIEKTYIADVQGCLNVTTGTIELPLGPDFSGSPQQIVDHQSGKPSETKYRVLQSFGEHTRVELKPVTGRTHQLRVHCSSAEGLNCPIIGDRLYGSGAEGEVLHLHASCLKFRHPFTGESIELKSEPSF